jgi:hypothetical protein
MTRDGHRSRDLVDETGGHTRDAEDVRRMAHNPATGTRTADRRSSGRVSGRRFHDG